MKKLVLLVISVFCLQSYALTRCGDSQFDKNYSYLSWELAAQYQITSPYIVLSAIVCVGVDYGNGSIKRLHYRDTSGSNKVFDFEDLKRKDTIIISRSDFPSAARLVTRNAQPLTLKVTSDKMKSGKRYYTLDFKFIRNMARGFSSTDYRLMRVYAQVSTGSLGQTRVYLNQRRNQNRKGIFFNGVKLSVGADLKIKKLHFQDDYGKTLLTVSSYNFPRIQ